MLNVFLFFPQRSYIYANSLTRQVLSYDEWRDKSVLEEQPMRELTKPYFRFVQRCYAVLGLIQLTFMICFSHFYMPSSCSLVELFNASSPGCFADRIGPDSTTDRIDPDSTTDRIGPDSIRIGTDPTGIGSDPNARGGDARGNPSWLWLLWPVLLCAGNACDFLVDIFWISVASFCKYAGNCDAGVTHRGAERWPTKVLLVFGQMFPALSFCTSVFVWHYRHGSEDATLLPYLEATAMVFLFGWTTNLVFFSGMTQKFCVFALVLKEIIVKDILFSFLLVFLFTLLGFSFALHVLSLNELPSDDLVYLGATVYDLFAASLGSGDYVQTSREQRSRAGFYFGLFDVVVICYVCVSAIILLNVLIAMMNHRYDRAKERAENFWRFQILRIALDLELVPVLRRLFALLLNNDLEDPDLCGFCCGVCCCYLRVNQLQTDTARQCRKYLRVKLDIND